MNPLLDVEASDLFARISEHSDGSVDDEIDEIRRRLVVALYEVALIENALMVAESL